MTLKETIVYHIGKPSWMRFFRTWYWLRGNMWLWGWTSFVTEHHHNISRLPEELDN